MPLGPIQVEIWFSRITQQALRQGTFSSVKELVEKIDRYLQTRIPTAMRSHSSGLPRRIRSSFKVERLRERIYGSAH
jgi:hypothetical protein